MRIEQSFDRLQEYCPKSEMRQVRKKIQNSEMRDPILDLWVYTSGIPGVRVPKSGIPIVSPQWALKVRILLGQRCVSWSRSRLVAVFRRSSRISHSLLLLFTGGSHEGFTMLNKIYIASASLGTFIHHSSKHAVFEKMQTLGRRSHSGQAVRCDLYELLAPFNEIFTTPIYACYATPAVYGRLCL